MAKVKEVYICSNCGYEAAKWNGKCPSCGKWNTFEQQQIQAVTPSSRNTGAAVTSAKAVTPLRISEIDTSAEVRYRTGLSEFDRVLGGGLVKGSVNLLSGDPGIGKSTLLLQICEYLGKEHSILYVSGEESIRQLKLRAQRLGVESENLYIISQTDVETIVQTIMVQKPDIVIIDSIQNFSYRILRAVKNRYGSTNEIGVFEMMDNGLNEVENPSMMLLSGRPKGVSGTCVACIMEGTRPIMAEVQALVTKTGFGTPRRMSAGFDYNRLSLLIAVLEKRAGYFFGALDTYINIVGGLRLDEPAADLSIVLALISSLRDKPLDDGLLAFGELGLAGEIRTVTNIVQRVKEAKRLGFTRCIVPKQALKQIYAVPDLQDGIEIIGVSNIKQASAAAFEK